MYTYTWTCTICENEYLYQQHTSCPDCPSHALEMLKIRYMNGEFEPKVEDDQRIINAKRAYEAGYYKFG